MNKIDLVKLEKRLKEASNRIKTCFIEVPLNDVEKLPDPDYGFDKKINSKAKN